MSKLFLFTAVIILSACSTYQVVNIDILSPSEYQIPPDIKELILLNNAKEQAPEVGHKTYKISISANIKTKKLLSEDHIKVDSTTSSALYNMYNHLNESLIFSSVKLGRKKPEPRILFGNIERVFQQYPADALLVLESLTYNDDQNQIYYTYSDSHNTEIEIITQSEWRIYYANKPYKPYPFSITDTLYWNQNDADRVDCVQEAVWNNARLAAEKIIPYWITVNRFYYTGMSFVYNEIDEAIKINDWETAAKSWMSLYNSSKKDTKQKGKIAFNMALFFEIKNDLETSIMWLNTAINIFEKKEADRELEVCSLYIKVLNKRLINQKKLDQQFIR